MWLGSCSTVALARLAATAPIEPLPWETPFAMGVALKGQKKKNTKKKLKTFRKLCHPLA